jgi:hypothetical protein
LLLASALSACQQAAIEWSEPTPLAHALSTATELAFDQQQNLVSRPLSAIPVRGPVAAAQCPASLRVSKDSTGDWYAAWWSVRPDSTADVVVSRSMDGVTWTAPVRVDTTDVGHVGCQRPAPSIAADGGNVHVAYAMTAREGPGIFASHSMDRGMLFHSPVTIVYGERIGSTAVAARGDLVAVAYEDPNSNPQRVGLAFSHTLGHTYDTREIVSPPTGDARAPGVALGEKRIAVTWARGASGDPSVFRVVRLGDIR